MEYTIIIQKNKNGWYTGQCEQIPEAISQGETLEELKEKYKKLLSPRFTSNWIFRNLKLIDIDTPYSFTKTTAYRVELVIQKYYQRELIVTEMNEITLIKK